MNKTERGILLFAALMLLTTLTFLPRGEAKRSTQERSTQEKVSTAQPIFSQAVRAGVSDEVKNLPAASAPRSKYGEELEENEINEKNSLWVYGPIQQQPESRDGALMSQAAQALAPELEIPAPITSFDGMSNADNFAAFGFRLSPPDTDGDVGPNHYVAQVNLLVRIYSKLGVPAGPPFKLSSLFAPLGGICSTNDNGDPIVLYDPLADRWLLSQFAFTSTTTPPYHMCIAISKTPNPTGAYFLYDFVVGGNEFPDYPKLGVWPDGYYITTRQFTNGGPFHNPGAGVFDRTKMLAGDPTAGQIYFNLGTSGPLAGGVFDGLLPSDFDGLTAPPAGRPNTFAIMTANEFGGGQIDAVRLFDFHADFGIPANSTFTERAESPVVVAAFNPITPGDIAGNRRDIPQPPPAVVPLNNVDSITRLLHRLQYVNYGTFDSLVMNHSVDADATAAFRSGVRYYQFRNASPGVSPFTVAEQATHAPADTENRWMASAAADNQSNIAVGYSVSSISVFPSVRYAGRLVTDPPGGLFQGENSLVAGSGVQLSTTNRWGDYSAMNVDPSDQCTFWYTQEYYTAASQATSVVGWLTRIGSFKFAECTTPPKGTLNVTVTDCTSGLPIQGASVTINGNVYGSTLADGTFSTQLAPGSYTVSVAKPGYSVPASQMATITNGGVTSLTFCMNQIAVPAAAGLTLVNESCPPFNSAADPGERVSVNLAVMNNGAVSSTNMVGTLQPSANVLAPSGPESYGSIAPGGTATRTFSFTANGTCGQTITLTLQLQDGANNLGTVTYTMMLGGLGAPVTATYSSGNIAVPVPDNTTVEVPITVSDTGSVADVNVRIRINHTFDSDMVISLVHPDGTVVTLAQNRGGAGANFGTGANDCSGTPTIFDDEAGPTIASGVAPFAGSFKPDAPLSALDGKPSSGTWKLRVQDQFTLDTGTIGCVQLEITRQPFVCNNSCTQARLVVTQTLGCSGSNVTATICVENQGITAASAVTLTSVTLGASSATSLPGPIPTIAPGAKVCYSPITFTPNPTPGSKLLKVKGTYDGSSTFSKSQNVIVPSCP